MANKKITELTNLETPAASDVFVVVDIDADETKKVTLANLKPVIDTIASSNINTVSDNVTAVETRRVANVTEQTAIEARRNTNVTVAASNDFVTFTRLQANIDVVQDNVAAITTTLAIKGDSGTDSVTVGGEQLIFKGDTGITTSVSSNTVTIDLDDTSVTAGLYGGVSGGVTNVASVTIDATGRVTNAANVSVVTNLDTLQDNINALDTQVTANLNTLDANADAIEARRVANVTVMNTADTALQSRLSTNVTALTNEDTALQSRLGTNVTALTNSDTAIELRRTNNIAGAVSTITTGNLTASRALVSDGSGKVAVSDVTSTELGHLDGVTSAIQTQINAVESRRASNLTGGSSFTGQVNMSDDLIVSGNLVVNGDTTTANSVNLVVQDRIIMLANSVAGAPSADVGLLFNRGNQGNAALFYDESAKTFKFSDTKDPHSNTSLSPVTASNLDVGIITAATVTLDGASVATMISDNVSGAISTASKGNNMTASRALVSDASGKIAPSAVTATELSRLDGVTSAIQTQLDAKQATITGAATTIDDADLTADRAVISSGSGKVAVSAVTATEIGHLDGVTSAIQTQLNTLTTNINTLDSNADANFTQLNANINVLDSNADAIEARRVANVTEQTAIEARRVANIAGAVSTITTSDLTASRAIVSSGSGKVAVSAVTATELGHLDGVTSAIQTQLDAKQATITGAATTIDDSDLTASRALVSDGSGKVAVSAVTSTEIGHLDGVTGAIQTQINGLETRRNANVTVAAANNAAVETRRTNNIAGAVSTITTSDLTASRAVVSSGSGKIAVSAVTATELGHLDGVTSAIQTQLNAKQATITGAATTIDDSDLTASRALVSDGSGKVAVSAVTSTEIGHLDGVTSAIQTQINGLETRRNANVTVAAANNAAVETRRTNNIAGAVSTITTSDLTASRALVSSGSGKVAVSAVTATEIGHLDGVTSAIQTQLNALETRRTNNIAGAISTVLTSDLTASRAVVSGSGGKLEVSAVTSTEIGHLDGVTSGIQTQLNGLETRRTNNIAGAISTVLTGNLTTARVLVSDGSGKISVSDITTTELNRLDGITATISSNTAELAAGIAGTSVGGFSNTDTDFSTLTSANASSTDAFGEAVGGLETFDLLDEPSGSLDEVDCIALS